MIPLEWEFHNQQISNQVQDSLIIRYIYQHIRCFVHLTKNKNKLIKNNLKDFRHLSGDFLFFFSINNFKVAKLHWQILVILKRQFTQTWVGGSHWLPWYGKKYYVTLWLLTFFKRSSFVFRRRKKLVQVWNNLRMSKWWQNLIFGWTVPLIRIHAIGNFRWNEKFSFASSSRKKKVLLTKLY